MFLRIYIIELLEADRISTLIHLMSASAYAGKPRQHLLFCDAVVVFNLLPMREKFEMACRHSPVVDFLR